MPVACLEPLLVIILKAREVEEWQMGVIDRACQEHFETLQERVRDPPRFIKDCAVTYQ